MFANFTLYELRDKFHRMSMREQMLVVLVLSAALYYLFDALVFTPQNRREQSLVNNQKVLQAQVMVLSAEISAIDRMKVDNLEQQEQEFRRIKKQATHLQAMVEGVMSEAPQIRTLVAEVLGTPHARVSAVGVKTLPVKALLGGSKASSGAATKAASPANAVVYKHGIDLELRGNYLDLMNYLSTLEQTHPKMFWSNAVLNASTYPESTLRVSVFLLSTQSNP